MVDEFSLRELKSHNLNDCSCVHLFEKGDDHFVAVGRTDGELEFLHWPEFKHITQASGCGYCSCISSGNVLNTKNGASTLLTVIGLEGRCQVFDFSDDLKPIAKLTQMLYANIVCSFVGDVDGDAQNELVVGLSDRVIRSYRYQESFTNGNGTASKGTSLADGGGYLQPIQKWELPSQVLAISLHLSSRQMIVTQAELRYIEINLRANDSDVEVREFCYPKSQEDPCEPRSDEQTTEKQERDVFVPIFIHDYAAKLSMFHEISDRFMLISSTGERILIRLPTPVFQCVSFLEPNLILWIDWFGNLFVLHNSKLWLSCLRVSVSLFAAEFIKATQTVQVCIYATDRKLISYSFPLKRIN